MTMINLYPFQAELVDRTRSAFAVNKSVLMQSPTGSGKTAMSIHIMQSMLAKGKRGMFVVPRKQLFEQSLDTFQSYGVKCEQIKAGARWSDYGSMYVAIDKTLSLNLDRAPDVDLVVIDEAHYGEGTMDKIVAHYKASGAYILGLSATPWRMSGKGLGRWFDDMVCGPTVRELIDDKRLSDYRYFRAERMLDLSGIKQTAGEYNQREMSDYMEGERQVIGDCVSDYKARAYGKLHLVRCTSIKHSQLTTAAFVDAGIRAFHVDGTKTQEELRAIIRAFARREIMVLTFCDLLNFGFDLAQASGMDVCVESGSDLKPSKSLAGQMQFWGRMLRYKPEPALILDHVNNWQEHGLPCTEREWSLADVEKKSRAKKDNDAPPVKQCLKCFHVHKPAPVCPNCGALYEIKARDIKQIAGELREVDLQNMKLEKKVEQRNAGTYAALVELGKARGYKNPQFWAMKVYHGRQK